MRGRAGRASVALVAAAVGLGDAAWADAITLPDTRATLVVPAGWQPVAGSGLVAAYRTRGAVLAITRAPVPNPDAWRARTRDAYVAEIERGIASAVAGYRRRARTVREVAGVPTVDLEATRRDGATLVIRVLLFRTYALMLAIEVDPGARSALATARATAATFAPPAAER